MRRVEYYHNAKGWIAVRDADYRLLRAVVRQAESDMFTYGASRKMQNALDAFNAKGKRNG